MDNRQPPPQSLLDSLPDAATADPREPAPVHLWHPEFSGELDMHIARDGTWYHEGGPITRKSLAQLFSGILRLDEDGRYYLVTPVERWAIKVDDVPFVAVQLAVDGQGSQQRLTFTTSLGHCILAGEANPITVTVAAETGEPSPYVLVRSNLQALIHRNVFYELAELAVEEDVDGHPRVGVWSDGKFFPIDGAPASA